MPRRRAWRQAEPGWRSAAGTQGAQGRMPVANVRRRGMGNPEPPRDSNATAAALSADLPRPGCKIVETAAMGEVVIERRERDLAGREGRHI